MILDQFKLTGKVALVTGGSRGLGKAMAIALAEAGADVAVAASSSEPTETVEAITALGRRSLGLTCDLANAEPSEVTGLVERCHEEFGRLDILVNNAGVIRRAPAMEFSPADWDEVIRVNQTAPFFLAQAAARKMTEGGRIINTASLLSFQGGITVPSYTASKSAIAGLTKALANEWAPLGINVNAIVPGYFATDNTAALQQDPERSQAILARIPAGRWGAPADIAGITVFLASAAAEYVHGALMPVDGGWLAR